MAFYIPPCVMETQEISFDSLGGPLHDQLRDMLWILGEMESPRMLGTSHYDGNVHAKNVVELILPKTLGLRVSRFSSEARHTHVAWRMVMVNAIISIRQERARSLRGYII